MQDTIDGQLGAILVFRPIILYEGEVSQKRHESRLYLEVPRHEATLLPLEAGSATVVFAFKRAYMVRYLYYRQ
jgi:hypothetical protein